MFGYNRLLVFSSYEDFKNYSPSCNYLSFYFPLERNLTLNDFTH